MLLQLVHSQPHRWCPYVPPIMPHTPRLLFRPQALPIFLRGLEVPVQRETLHSGVRQYLHRMIICLGDELLQFIPMTVQLLLKDCSVSGWGRLVHLVC